MNTQNLYWLGADEIAALAWRDGSDFEPTPAVIEYEAAARSRWDARFGEGSWDAKRTEGLFTHEASMRSAVRDVSAALGTGGIDDGDV
jgi:hypothetical protein